MPLCATPLIQDLLMSSGESPGPEVVFPAVEVGQAVDQLEKDLLEEIVRVFNVVGSQIAQDAGREVAVQIRPSPVGSDACGRKGRRKV
jgi:hypothetical protein